MSGPLRLITWATAIIAGVIVGEMLYGVSRLTGASDAPDERNWTMLIFSLLVGLLLQVGLFISPFVIERNVFARLGAIALMIPFAYFFLLHDAIDFGRHIISIDNYYIEDWKLNLRSHLMSTLMILVTTFVYVYNIILLLWWRGSSARQTR